MILHTTRGPDSPPMRLTIPSSFSLKQQIDTSARRGRAPCKNKSAVAFNGASDKALPGIERGKPLMSRLTSHARKADRLTRKEHILEKGREETTNKVNVFATPTRREPARREKSAPTPMSKKLAALTRLGRSRAEPKLLAGSSH